GLCKGAVDRVSGDVNRGDIALAYLREKNGIGNTSLGLRRWPHSGHVPDKHGQRHQPPEQNTSRDLWALLRHSLFWSRFLLSHLPFSTVYYAGSGMAGHSLLPPRPRIRIRPRCVVPGPSAPERSIREPYAPRRSQKSGGSIRTVHAKPSRSDRAVKAGQKVHQKGSVATSKMVTEEAPSGTGRRGLRQADRTAGR